MLVIRRECLYAASHDSRLVPRAFIRGARVQPGAVRPRGGPDLVSSAILYLAIVVIWACVLIPRWLRRDSARGASNEPDATISGDMILTEDVPDNSVSRDVVRADTVSEPPPTRAEAPERRPDHAREPTEPDAGTDAPPPPTPEESRRRMLAARRRLLGMMFILQLAAIALAVVGIAAVWVVIPPSVMLVGYLLLLREAAHADAEKERREWESAQARARARARVTKRRLEPAFAVTAPPTASANYEDSGRDFAPGLAGKYTTSTAAVIDLSERDDDDRSDQYARNKLRAVGD